MVNSKYEGKVFRTNTSGDLVVTKYINAREVHVKFIDTGYETVATSGHIKAGSVKDKLKPKIYGIGVLGDEVTQDLTGVTLKVYALWKNMLKRCYYHKHVEEYPTYKSCTTSENFNYYPYFKSWCNKQTGFNAVDDKGNTFTLDKDILIKGNKLYSEDTCCFVPEELNLLLVNNASVRGKYPVGVFLDKKVNNFKSKVRCNGKVREIGTYNTPEEAFLAYKQAKEAYIKEVANKWKDQIDIRVYEALMKYEVDIND